MAVSNVPLDTLPHSPIYSAEKIRKFCQTFNAEFAVSSSAASNLQQSIFNQRRKYRAWIDTAVLTAVKRVAIRTRDYVLLQEALKAGTLLRHS